MNMAVLLSGMALVVTQLIGCTSVTEKAPPRDLVVDTYPEAQQEVRNAVAVIFDDLATANVDGLRASHLHSEKFTKFGPRKFERQDVDQCNASEEAFFTSIQDFQAEIRDLKVDVFGEVAIATYYPHVSFMKNGESKQGSGRQTLVFLKTDEGWKIIHEHGTPKSKF